MHERLTQRPGAFFWENALLYTTLLCTQTGAQQETGYSTEGFQIWPRSAAYSGEKVSVVLDMISRKGSRGSYTQQVRGQGGAQDGGADDAQLHVIQQVQAPSARVQPAPGFP